jgi:hypothetical protein
MCGFHLEMRRKQSKAKQRLHAAALFKLARWYVDSESELQVMRSYLPCRAGRKLAYGDNISLHQPLFMLCPPKLEVK